MEKKEKIKLVVVSVVVSMIVTFIGCIGLIRWANGLNLDVEDFELSDINYTKNSYTYLSDISYSGEGRIYCKDTASTYIVVIAETLISGGDTKDIGQTIYETVIITNGTGSFSTYDYGEDIQQPNYDVQVIGFKKLQE